MRIGILLETPALRVGPEAEAGGVLVERGSPHQRVRVATVLSFEVRSGLHERRYFLGVLVDRGSEYQRAPAVVPSFEVCACLQQQRDHLGDWVVRGGIHQRRRAVPVPSIHVRALLDGSLYLLRCAITYKFAEVRRLCVRRSRYGHEENRNQ